MGNIKNEIERLKNAMHLGMVENFRRDGRLAPMLFILCDDGLKSNVIPMEFFRDSETKNILAQRIKATCLNPRVYAVGMIMEANMKQVSADDPVAKELLKGNISFKEMDVPSVDIIAMNISSPEEEIFMGYYVDPKTKTVKEQIPQSEESHTGIFSNFFGWKNN